MVYNETNASLWPCAHSLHYISWTVPCTVCRLGGTLILLISIVCFSFNIRFLFSHRCKNSLAVSLFLASLLVITISVPGVIVQLFTCHRHCLKIYCRIEGFCSYLSGCVCMLVFMSLSIHRYLSLCSCKNSLSYGVSTCFSWSLSLAFTFPLVFDYFNSYMPEGLGFHCSINWQDSSSIGRAYILSSFIFMYFIPLTILVFVNVQAHLIVRRIYTKENLHSTFINYMHQKNATRKSRQEVDYKNTLVHKYCVRVATDRKRFRTDYRFLRAIIFLVSSYLIAWTPYSVIAVLQLLNIGFIFDHAFLITLSAFIAKLSVILSPLVYLSIMNNKLFKRILFK
ncbi:unnamed protein product [Rotaria socialis]|uniref:G-protein coupled receptors family 1 profile domain-containing protein n=1 Tax=Rotaria socialis TaxID=392032 RepID=A0A821IHA6_9BILA|nr:unnamed protein product [Rotaria socialis]CAF3322320.1 unnamed protein product [Rotaria socialis]CAF3416842.1 unnamed protein product [Rotaria socialis]CAF3466227.1 unnamed protein product [Rotaria socialis]CAF3501142.1 unnamed protein product [Rotaria socialis]